MFVVLLDLGIIEMFWFKAYDRISRGERMFALMRLLNGDNML